MINNPKGGQGSDLYKLGLHHTLVVDRGKRGREYKAVTL